MKLDELIRVSAAQNSFVGIEHLTDEELGEKSKKCENRSKSEKANSTGDASEVNYGVGDIPKRGKMASINLIPECQD